MKIVLIGSGNVASHLGPALKKSGHKFLQVYGRTEHDAASLAKKLSCGYVTETNSIQSGADVYLIALRDEAIASILNKVPKENGIVLHTSGAIPISVFKNKFKHFGVVYPLQTFSMNRKLNLSRVPFCIEANSVQAEKKIRSLFKGVSGHIHRMNSKQRLVLHIAAVFANNFSNHLFALSEKLLSKQGIDFSLLRPLIMETAKKVQHNLPVEMQTGPAKRGDQETIEAHLRFLKGQAFLPEIYKLLTESIKDVSGPRF